MAEKIKWMELVKNILKESPTSSTEKARRSNRPDEFSLDLSSVAFSTISLDSSYSAKRGLEDLDENSIEFDSSKKSRPSCVPIEEASTAQFTINDDKSALKHILSEYIDSPYNSPCTPNVIRNLEKQATIYSISKTFRDTFYQSKIPTTEIHRRNDSKFSDFVHPSINLGISQQFENTEELSSKLNAGKLTTEIRVINENDGEMFKNSSKVEMIQILSFSNDKHANESVVKSSISKKSNEYNDDYENVEIDDVNEPVRIIEIKTVSNDDEKLDDSKAPIVEIPSTLDDKEISRSIESEIENEAKVTHNDDDKSYENDKLYEEKVEKHVDSESDEKLNSRNVEDDHNELSSQNDDESSVQLNYDDTDHDGNESISLPDDGLEIESRIDEDDCSRESNSSREDSEKINSPKNSSSISSPLRSLQATFTKSENAKNLESNSASHQMNKSSSSSITNNDQSSISTKNDKLSSSQQDICSFIITDIRSFGMKSLVPYELDSTGEKSQSVCMNFCQSINESFNNDIINHEAVDIHSMNASMSPIRPDDDHENHDDNNNDHDMNDLEKSDPPVIIRNKKKKVRSSIVNYETHLRRSKRNRIKPLDYWRSERPIYKQINDQNIIMPVLVGVSQPQEINRIRRSNKRNKKKIVHENHYNEDIPAPQIRKQRFQNVLDLSVHSKKFKSLNDCESSYNKYDFQPSDKSKGVYTALIGGNDNKTVKFGMIRFEAFATKNKGRNGAYFTNFTVIYGTIMFKIDDEDEKIAKTGAHFSINPRSYYLIQNVRDDEALLKFTIIKTVDQSN